MITKYYHTLRHLKPIQFAYRLRRYAQTFIPSPKCRPPEHLTSNQLVLADAVPSPVSWNVDTRTFTFLNRSYAFDGEVDWNFSGHGKLWTYNLNYFDFLGQSELAAEDAQAFIHAFVSAYPTLKDGLEPYPTSLRLINWIKYCTYSGVTDPRIHRVLWCDLQRLKANLEYHLMGNHLLENAFALLFGAYFFDDRALFDQSTELLTDQLNEQVLSDGAHFERSPMYHQILLSRLLDSVNLVQNNQRLEPALLSFLIQKASLMLKWLMNVTFSNNDIPLVNDSAFRIAPSTKQLLHYAQRLNIKVGSVPLGASGYRRWQGACWQLLMDVGDIGPDYIPGHAHSDTLSFVLYSHGHPFIVDTGTSTYETGDRRLIERSTASHNTVQIDDVEQSECWGGFRVARRAKAHILNESSDTITASHSGYGRFGFRHERQFRSNDDNQIEIIDAIHGHTAKKVCAYFHFHPNIDVKLDGKKLMSAHGSITFEHAEQIELTRFEYAPEFNKTYASKKAVVTFFPKLKTTIQISA